MNEYYNIDDIIKLDYEYLNKYEYEEYHEFNKYYSVSYEEFLKIKYNINNIDNDIYNDIYNCIS